MCKVTARALESNVSLNTRKSLIYISSNREFGTPVEQTNISPTATAITVSRKLIS